MMDNAKYISVTTQEFKTHFARLVREVQMDADKDGIKITNHGRLLGIFVPNRK